MKIFWSWQSDTPGEIGRYLVRNALKDAIEELKQAEEIEDATREKLHLDQDIQGVTGSPDLARTIFDKIEKAEVVVADATIVGKTEDGDRLVNSNVGIELGYALHACTDARVVLVFNKHYGTYEELPFDLRHKGGAVVFDLAPGAQKKDIEAQRKSLTDDFIRKLKPFGQLPSRIKEPLSVRAVIEHRLERAHPMPGGTTDDRYELAVGLENNGEQKAPDFRLGVEIPTQFVDESGHRLQSRSSTPGFIKYEIDDGDEVVQGRTLYPTVSMPSLIVVHYAVRAQTKAQHPEDLEKEVIATVFSGNMKPKKTVLTIAELMG
jgi:hypothetical protein